MDRILPTAAMLAVKGLIGGLFVVAFSVLARGLAPKRFAGLFSAAPSVALASLAVVIVAKGHPEAVANAGGMLVGAAAFVAGCLVGLPVVRRHGASLGSAAICATWLAVAGAGWLMGLAGRSPL